MPQRMTRGSLVDSTCPHGIRELTLQHGLMKMVPAPQPGVHIRLLCSPTVPTRLHASSNSLDQSELALGFTHSASDQNMPNRITAPEHLNSVSLEKLHGLLVLLRRSTTLERAEVPTLPRLWILLSRVKPILTRFQFANHMSSENP